MKALIFGVFLGVLVSGRVAYGDRVVQSMNHVHLRFPTFDRRGEMPIKLNVRKPHPEYNVDQHGDHEAQEGTPGPTSCQTAPQWEGRASEWDHLQGGNNRFNVTFDGVNRRKRIMEDKHAQLPGKRIYEYIMLYDDGIQYVINHNYNTCSIEPLGTWRNHTIPPNATLEDTYEIGAPGSGFLVQEWSDRIPGRQRESWIGTFTDQGCWPIMEVFMEKGQNNTMVQSVSTRFFDLTTGIKNMSVFEPPSYCPKPRQRPFARPDSPASPVTMSRVELSRRLPKYPHMRAGDVEQLLSKLQRTAGSSRLSDQGRRLLE